MGRGIRQSGHIQVHQEQKKKKCVMIKDDFAYEYEA
jgi:hypothetical protein